MWIFPFVFFFLGFSSYPQNQPFLRLSVKDHPGLSRVLIESSIPLSFSIERSGSFLFVKLRANKPFRIQRRPFRSRFIKSLGWASGRDFYTITIRTQQRNFSYDSFTISDPPQLVIDVSPNGGEERRDESRESPKRISVETNKEERKVPSASPGRKSIVIDPGHGGLESGAKGKFGALEKDITLDISLRLKNIIEQKLAYNVVLTRDKDVDVSLENRAAEANNYKAYLFISIHANSSYRKEARGSETFFLSLNATDEEARRLAYLENNSAEFEDRIGGDNEDDIKMILWDMAQATYLKQSSQLAESIQKELNLLLGTINRGIKQAPFKVLTGVACPAVLVEVAFISNPEEERKLLTEEFQNNVAQAIYRGLVNFLRRYSQE